MRILNHFETLVYYDGPQLFIAYDQLRVAYVCLLAERQDEFDRYLCIPVSQARLKDFVNGEIDLRAIFEYPESDERFTCDVTDDRYDKIEIFPISGKNIPSSWLPDPGFVMEREPAPDIKVVEESQQRQRAIIHCALKPPESKSEPKITAEHLGQAVRLVQRVIKHAFRKALRGLDDKLKIDIDIPGNYELEIFAFSEGSFTIHMQTATSADILGYSEIAKALNILDSINQIIDDPEYTVDVVARYGGHFATAYRDLIQFVVESETPLSYEWSMPELRGSVTRKITVKQAKPLYQALIKREEIGREEKRLVGRLTKVDDPRGTWRLLSEEDQHEYSGRIEEADGVDLGGMIIRTQRYEFLCEERLEEQKATGRETAVLYLKRYRLLP